jgi:hypothetical protein
MALFVLGFGSPLGTLIDASRDDTGLLLDEEPLPKRVRGSALLLGYQGIYPGGLCKPVCKDDWEYLLRA